ncbi:MAG: zinc ribbon domain-containing protein [Xanthobacteraceae bacterium]
MPVYDYLCARCGPFTEIRPMADYDVPQQCPACGSKAPRVLLAAPYLAAMPADRRLAYATNERSASAPSALSELKNRHGAGCRCCAGKPLRSDKPARNDSGRTTRKSFPMRRPWMLSH